MKGTIDRKRSRSRQEQSDLNNKPDSMNADLIAPCGMNCRLCRRYGREDNPCPGCHGDDDLKMKTAAGCRIKNCDHFKTGTFSYCFDCGHYPCADLNHLDKRYRTKYGMSMIDNLEMIKNSGMDEFLKQEKQRWTCSNCGETICVHRETCVACGQKWR